MRISPLTSVPLTKASLRTCQKDVPDPVFGKVTPRVVVQMPVRAEYSRTWRRITASLYEDIHRGTPALGEALRREDCARQHSRILLLFGRVRRWLHLQMVSHATAGLVSHALYPIGRLSCHLSSQECQLLAVPLVPCNFLTKKSLEQALGAGIDFAFSWRVDRRKGSPPGEHGRRGSRTAGGLRTVTESVHRHRGQGPPGRTHWSGPGGPRVYPEQEQLERRGTND